MKNKRIIAIFFDDLNENAQVRLIKDEMEGKVDGTFVVRHIDIDTDLYGYDKDPKKQTLEQHITARIFVNGQNVQKWILEWNCLQHEFTTIMKEDQNPTKH